MRKQKVQTDAATFCLQSIAMTIADYYYCYIIVSYQALFIGVVRHLWGTGARASSTILAKSLSSLFFSDVSFLCFMGT